MGEVGVAAAVHPLGVLGIGHAQLPLVAVLEVVGPQARLCVEVPHQAGGASVGEPLGLQKAPDSFFSIHRLSDSSFFPALIGRFIFLPASAEYHPLVVLEDVLQHLQRVHSQNGGNGLLGELHYRERLI